MAGNAVDVLLGGLFDVIGDEGTLLVPAFVPQYKIWRRDIPVSDQSTRPYVGAISTIVLSQPGALRSHHPTHSFAALGRRAEQLLAGHDADAACFEPMRALMAAHGKMLLIGCLKESPGFSTVHLAQYDLGLSQRHYAKWFVHVRLPGQTRTFYHPFESPGCSAGFDVFYSDYANDANLRTGYIGDAWTLCVDAERAFAIERAILSKNPRYCLCDDPTCVSCRILRGYNKRAAPIAFLRRAWRRLGARRGVSRQ